MKFSKKNSQVSAEAFMEAQTRQYHDMKHDEAYNHKYPIRSDVLWRCGKDAQWSLRRPMGARAVSAVENPQKDWGRTAFLPCSPALAAGLLLGCVVSRTMAKNSDVRISNVSGIPDELVTINVLSDELRAIFDDQVGKMGHGDNENAKVPWLKAYGFPIASAQGSGVTHNGQAMAIREEDERAAIAAKVQAASASASSSST